NLGAEWSASNAVIQTNGAGSWDVYVAQANAHVIIDVMGYFRAPSGGSASPAFVQGGNAFNAPAVLGTTDAQPLTLKANNETVWKAASGTLFDQTAPTVVAGSSANSADGVIGATIAGGGRISGDPPVYLGNQVTQHYGTIGGGFGNVAGNLGFVGG